jgi:hypothetical protein
LSNCSALGDCSSTGTCICDVDWYGGACESTDPSATCEVHFTVCSFCSRVYEPTIKRPASYTQPTSLHEFNLQGIFDVALSVINVNGGGWRGASYSITNSIGVYVCAYKSHDVGH